MHMDMCGIGMNVYIYIYMSMFFMMNGFISN